MATPDSNTIQAAVSFEPSVQPLNTCPAVVYHLPFGSHEIKNRAKFNRWPRFYLDNIQRAILGLTEFILGSYLARG